MGCLCYRRRETRSSARQTRYQFRRLATLTLSASGSKPENVSRQGASVRRPINDSSASPGRTLLAGHRHSAGWGGEGSGEYRAILHGTRKIRAQNFRPMRTLAGTVVKARALRSDGETLLPLRTCAAKPGGQAGISANCRTPAGMLPARRISLSRFRAAAPETRKTGLRPQRLRRGDKPASPCATY